VAEFEALCAPRTILFDIDGTLATKSSDHLSVLAAVARRELATSVTISVVAERPWVDDTDVTGWIDAQVWRHLIAAAGLDPNTPGLLSRLVRAYGAAYADALSSGMASPGVLVPGAAEALRHLSARGVRLGVVTGNAHAVAAGKLRALGLAGFFDGDPDAGFGDWRADRQALPAAALAALGCPPGPSAWLVGDTVADMRAARGAGMTPVGTLTGGDDIAALKAAGAYAVVPSVAELA
jgi:phosphoglycolate phosphatase